MPTAVSDHRGSQSTDLLAHQLPPYRFQDVLDPDLNKVIEKDSVQSSQFSRLHPTKAHSVIALPLVVLAIATLASLPCLGWWLDGAYSSMSMQYSLDKAGEAMRAGQLDAAIGILEQSQLAHRLSDSQRRLLNQAYMARGDQLAEQRNYKLAVSVLSRVSADAPGYQAAARKIAAYKELLQAGTGTLSGITSATRAGARTSHRSNLETIRRFSAVSPVGQVTHRAQEREPGAAIQTGDKIRGSGMDGATVSGVKSKEQSKGVEKGLENDDLAVARYNELLADYFSDSSPKSLNKGAASGPPSFKEWIKDGKPVF